MTREIKFRTWDGRVMQYPKYSKKHNCPVLRLVEFLQDKTSYSNYPEVILMQFTGLFDRNDREIYEGDILRSCVYAANQSKHFEVLFEKDGYFVSSNRTKANWAIGEKYRISEWISLLEKYEIELVGNIFENKNLLI